MKNIPAPVHSKFVLVKGMQYLLNIGIVLWLAYGIYLAYGLIVIFPRNQQAATHLLLSVVQELLTIILGFTIGLGIVNYLIEKYGRGRQKPREYLWIGMIELIIWSCFISHTSWVNYHLWVS